MTVVLSKQRVWHIFASMAYCFWLSKYFAEAVIKSIGVFTYSTIELF